MRNLAHLIATSAVAAVFVSAFAGQAFAQNRIVYVFAGQSNTSELGVVSSSGCQPAVPASGNVSFTRADLYTGGVAVPHNFAGTPLESIGELLGAHHATLGETVEVLMLAQPGSALLERNFQPSPGVFVPLVFGAWIDQAWPANPFTWSNVFQPALSGLALQPGDELHIVWGQGESDCWLGATTGTQEYLKWAQTMFARLASHANKTDYDVHLVTLGAMYVPPPQMFDKDANRVRDSFFLMPSAPNPVPGVTARIAPAAHHYDLAHRDGFHLQSCAYEELGRRIVTGILNPAQLPLVVTSGVSVVGGQKVLIPTSIRLAPVPLGTSLNKLFEVTVAGVPLASTAFQVSASGSLVTVYVPGGGLTATNVSVRYVAGSGFGLPWDTMAPITAQVSGLPLEPFRVP